MAAGDRLRAAREAWERVERSTRRLEDAHRAAGKSLDGVRMQADAAAAAAARAREEAVALLAAVKSVFWWLCALVGLCGLIATLAGGLVVGYLVGR